MTLGFVLKKGDCISVGVGCISVGINKNAAGNMVQRHFVMYTFSRV